MRIMAFEFSVYCNACGRSMCNQVASVNGLTIHIDPCPWCMTDKEKESYNDGLASAHEALAKINKET